LRLVLAAALLSLLSCKTRSDKPAPAARGTAAAAEAPDKKPGVIPLVRIGGRDWGYPSPYAFYPRGPGYVRMTLLFDTLVWRDEKGLVPWLARRWEAAEGGRRWTVELRDDARWHDGKPLTADDVKFTFEYLKRYPHTWFDLSPVEGVDVAGPRRLVFRLARPYAVFETRVLMRTPILPRHIWKDVDNPYTYAERAAVVGSGPFTLERYDRVQGSYVFRANERFFLGRPRVKRVAFVKTKTPAVALLKGEIDMTRILNVDALGMFRGKPGFKILTAPDYWLFRLLVNFDKEPMARVGFRRALAHAIDRAEMVKRVAHGGAVVGTFGYISPASEWHNPRTADYPHDPARARRLLDELGLRDENGDGVRELGGGRPLSLVLLSDNRFARAAEVVRGYLEDVGIEVTIRSADVSTHDSDIRKMKGFHLAVTAHGGVTGDLGNLTGGLPAIVGYRDPEFTRLVREQPFMGDAAGRRRALHRIQELIARDVATIPLYYLKWFHVYRPAAFDGWFYARHGLPIGVQLLEKKLVFLRR